MKIKIPKKLIKLTGDIYLHKYPMFIVYKPDQHRLKGDKIREILNTIQPGDILLRRFDSYLNTILTPGFWGHAGLYIGNNSIIHSIGKGVIEEDILNFCRTDSLAVLNANVIFKVKNNAIKNIKKLKGSKYDFKFNSNDDKYYCTELIDVVYNGIFYKDYKKIMSNYILTPDGIYDSIKVTKNLIFK
jgi:uncharacterized protein YycO